MFLLLHGIYSTQKKHLVLLVFFSIQVLFINVSIFYIIRPLPLPHH